MDLWYWKQPLYQLSYNHFPLSYIFNKELVVATIFS